MIRTMLVWCPDWPVLAAEIVEGVPAHEPVAILYANRVVACSATARAEGVRRGLRRREAQGRCPRLAVLDHDPGRDARAYEPVVAAIEEMAPGVEVVRPGAAALAARGPARYFGSEERAAEQIVEHVAQACGVEAQVGIADGVFAAVLAARSGRLVPPGRTASFLADLDISTVDRPALADLLRRLGITTLGQFAALPAADVLARFGLDAALVHRLAAGRDERPLAVRQPPADLAVTATFDEPLARIDTAAFAGRQLAERLHERLAGHGLACTRLGIAAVTGHGAELRRTWRHDGLLSAPAIADRVRWQLDGWLTGHRRRPGQAGGTGGRDGVEPVGDPDAGEGGDDRGGIVRLRLWPDGVIGYAGCQLGLWGDAGSRQDRAHRALTRVQGMLGPDAVVTAVPGGGRDPAERVRLVPWGDERLPARPADQPWPGRLPSPAPATVFAEPLPVEVYDESGAVVGVTGRLAMTGRPAWLVSPRRPGGGPGNRGGAGGGRAAANGRPGGGNGRPGGGNGGPGGGNGGRDAEPVAITGWAGPWPVDERWWAPDEASRRVRFQVCLSDGRAMLLTLAAGCWSVTALYD